MIESLLTIGIATKNRHEELNVTLRAVRSGPLRDCRIIVVDDGSEPAIQIDKEIERVELVRHESSKDVAYSRNEIASLIRTPFWMTLDDDSHPTDIDLKALILLLENSGDVIAISFPFKEYVENSWKWLNASSKSSEYPVRTFVACSAVINVGRFKEIGGYSDWIYQFGEESDLTLRGFKAGFSTIHSDSVKVQHNKVNVARSMDRIDFFGARNQILMAVYYLPIRFIPLRIGKLICHHGRNLILKRRFKGVWGIFCGLVTGFITFRRHKNSSLSVEEYCRYRNLPSF